MYKQLLPFFLFFVSSLISSEWKERGDEALQRGNFKEAIHCFQKLPEAKLLLTDAFLKDQQHGMAIQTFLEALETAPAAAAAMSAKEETLYEEALEMFLAHHGVLSHDAASRIRQRFAPIIERHPEFLALTFILALAHAGLENYSDFFTLYYRAYCAYPEHYFAYKIKGLLHIKLFERLPWGAEKEAARQNILDNLRNAETIFSRDPSLYLLLVLFAGEQNKKELLTASLNKMMEENIIVSRSEIQFYVRCAKEHQLDELAGRFIKAAKKWYPSSRFLLANSE